MVARDNDIHAKGEVMVPSKTPLSVACRIWVESMKADLSVNGYRTYQLALPHIADDPTGGIPVAKLTEGDLRGMKGRWLESGSAASTVNVWASVVRGTMKTLHNAGLITRNDSVKALKIHKDANVAKVVTKAWAVNEWNTFLDAIHGDKLEALWSLLALSGMRRGEALALRWSDVAEEPDANGLYRIGIEQNLVDSHRDGTFIIGATKSGKHGVAHIPQATMDLLLRWRHDQNVIRMAALDWIEDEFVFTVGHGRPWKPATVSTRFRRLVATLPVTKVSLHGLRHTALTIASNSGVDPLALQRMANHANFSTTERYVHGTGEGSGVLALVEQRRCKNA